VSSFLNREKQRLATSGAVVESREKRLQLLQLESGQGQESADNSSSGDSSSSSSSSSSSGAIVVSDSGLKKAVTTLNREVSVRSQKLLEAEEEEEKARLVSYRPYYCYNMIV
jgi:hypothetical protein